ncbi:MAG: NAD-dependent epimerase/dehydratase family protein [candidate division WOR-3 bacterium]
MKQLSDMKVLVTGGAGFVGSNLVDALVNRNVKTIVLDDLFTGKIENLPKSDLVEFVKGSVCDEELVRKLVKEVDLVFHLAARNIIVSTKNPREDFSVNIGGTLNILLAAKEKGIKVVYTSSTSIYGNPRYLPINEDDAINPFTPYATSKLAGENYCFSFYETYGLPTAVVRYSNIYGVKQRPDNPYCGVVAKFFDAVMRDQPPSIHGDGEQTRDFTYVDDAVEATILAASEKANGQIYNVGTGIETSINTLAQKIIKLFGKNITPTYIDRRDIDNIRRRVVNIEKIRKELRWIPKFSLDDGLKKTKEWIMAKRS